MIIEGRDAFGKIEQTQLRLEKRLERLNYGEIALSIDKGKRNVTMLQTFVVATCALARRTCGKCEGLSTSEDCAMRKIRAVFGTIESAGVAGLRR